MKTYSDADLIYLAVFAGCITLMVMGTMLALTQICAGAFLCNCGLDSFAHGLLSVLRFFFRV